MFGSAALRLAFGGGPVADFGPPALALGLAVAFLLVAGDPGPARPRGSR